MEDIKTIIWALEHYDFKLDCVPEKVVNMINELLNGYKKLQQENQQYKNKLNKINTIIKKSKLHKLSGLLEKKEIEEILSIIEESE